MDTIRVICQGSSWPRVSLAQWLTNFLPDPAAPGSFPSIPIIFSEENIVDVAEANQQRCSQESGLKMLNEPIKYRLVTT